MISLWREHQLYTPRQGVSGRPSDNGVLILTLRYHRSHQMEEMDLRVWVICVDMWASVKLSMALLVKWDIQVTFDIKSRRFSGPWMCSVSR